MALVSRLQGVARRAGELPPVASLRATLDHRSAQRLQPADPVLAAVRDALLEPAADERRWIDAIERVRAELEASDERVVFAIDDPAWWERAIARSKDPHPPQLRGDEVHRNLGELTRTTSRPADWGRFFYRVVRATRPTRCLELGTSVGMSGSYIGAGLEANGEGRLVTIEGQSDSARIARDVFGRVGVGERVEVLVGDFADVLGDALTTLGGVDLAFVDGHHLYEPTLAYFTAIAERAAPGALLVFDDVSPWHEGMDRAWTEIRADPRVTGSLTIDTVGFAVVGGRPAAHDRLPRLALRG